MTRQNKKTRIKGLPPRLQLQQKDATTGSYPTNSRIASDNRTGDYTISYDDRNTIKFGSRTLLGMTNISNSLIGYWKFTDPTLVSSSTENYRVDFSPTGFTAAANMGATATDLTFYVTGASEAAITTNKRDLPFRGNALGRFDASLNFPSVNSGPNFSVGSVTNPSFLNFSTGSSTLDKPFSISAWLKFTGSAPPVAAYVMRKVSVGGAFEWSFSVLSGRLAFAMFDTSSSNRIVATSANFLSVNNWIHIAGTYDGSGLEDGINLYINGVLDTSSVKSLVGSYTRMRNTGAPIVVGHDNITSPTFAFDGLLGEIAIYNKALSATEINAVYNTRTSLTAPAIDGVALGIGLEPQSPFLQSSDNFTDIFISSKVVKGIGDSIASFTPGQDLTPFKENNNPALDGLSSTSSFYAVGTPINVGGEGFDQPLWSKTKIQFELPVVKGVTNKIRTFISGGHNDTINVDPASGSVEKFFGPSPTIGGFVNLSYPMSYYNFKNQLWEGVGRGEAYCYTGTFRSKNGINLDAGPFYNTICIGFSQGLVSQREGIVDPGVSGAFEYMAGAGHPIANFGFPFDARYHATSSQLLPMNRFIDKPFVVEKIVVDFSGSFEFESENYTTSTIVPSINSVISSAFPAAINNFFILVQRKPYAFKTSFGVEARSGDHPILQDLFLDSKLPTNVTLSNAQGQTYVDTIRDILTFGGVSSFAANTPTEVTRQGNVGNSLVINASLSTKNPKQLMTRDVVFESSQSMVSNLTALNWSGSFRMELESRNPTSVFELFGIIEYGNNPIIGGMDTKFDFGGRNGLGVTSPSGRDIISPIVGINIESVATNGRTLKVINFADPKTHYRVGGYILKPEDNLIFGWQQPVPMTLTSDYSFRHVDDGFFSSMTFSDARITFYGSLLREGKEFHDTLNQLLISNSVHEVIE